jgi:hypothetical protein
MSTTRFFAPEGHTSDDGDRGCVTAPVPDEPLLKEHPMDCEAVWATHPLRDHARFGRARRDEREDGTTLLVLIGRSAWVPGAMRTPSP